MKSQQINIKRLNDNAVIPTYGSKESAGADLYSCLDSPIEIQPGDTVLIHIGISVEIPEGYAGFIYARSGLACKEGLTPANCVGVIDSDYRGEIMVYLKNHSDCIRVIVPGERVAQMVIAPFLRVKWNEVTELSGTDRGLSGFGSTGK